MRNLTFKKPYTDNILKWDEKTKQYSLTMEYVKNQFDITFRNDGVLERRIEKNSRKIYNYLKNRSYSVNAPIINAILNKTEEGRKFMTEILSSQIEADLETGFNDLTKQPAINTSNGQILPRDEFIKNQVSVDTELIADNNADYFGFNLFIQTAYPQPVYLFFMGLVNR